MPCRATQDGRVTVESSDKRGPLEKRIANRFPGGSEVKASAGNAGDLGLLPGSRRSPGEGNGHLLQYCCLDNPIDGGAWWATIYRVTKSRTRLSDFTFTFSMLALRTPWMNSMKRNVFRRKQYNSTQKVKKKLHKITQYVLFCTYELVELAKFVYGETKKQWLSLEWVGKWKSLESADLGVTCNHPLVKTQWNVHQKFLHFNVYKFKL